MKKFFLTLWAAFTAPFRQLTSQDLKVLAICMLLSTIFWFSITLNKTYSTSYMLYLRLPGQVYPVQVEVTGSGWALLHLSLRPPQDTLTFTVSAQEEVLPKNQLLPKIKQAFPGQVDINIISPDNIVLREASRIATKKITLIAPLAQIENLLCDSCYMATPPTIAPQQLIVEGESNRIKLLADTIVLPVYNRFIRDHFDITYRSEQLISQKGIKVKPATVRMHFRIGYFQENTLNIPVELKDFPEKGHWRVQPPYVKVRVRGKAETLSLLKSTPESIRAWVSFADASPSDSLQVQVGTSLKDIEIKKVSPSHVKLLHP
ncbi:MAG: hypothetical protein KatS3mg033_2082 [Thermonema sp.]|nr:MAG: hypothetical protein KatS3mg033_2082 [Thermonema sp.]